MSTRSNYIIGVVLAGIREGRQITQQEFGVIYRASASYISQLEHGTLGEITLPIIEIYSKIVDVPVSEILALADRFEQEVKNDDFFFELTRDRIKRYLKATYYRDKFEPRTRTIFNRPAR